MLLKDSTQAMGSSVPDSPRQHLFSARSVLKACLVRTHGVEAIVGEQGESVFDKETKAVCSSPDKSGSILSDTSDTRWLRLVSNVRQHV